MWSLGRVLSGLRNRAGAGQPAPDTSRQQVLASSRGAIASGALDDAAAALAEIVTRDGGDAEAHELLATIDYRRRDDAAAMEHISRALAHGAGIPAHVLRLKLAARIGDLPAATAMAEEALALAPEDAELLRAAARIFDRARRYDVSGPLWLRYAGKRPRNIAGLTAALRALLRTGKIEEARAVVDRARAAHPGSIELMRLALQVAVKRNEPAEIAVAVMAIAAVDIEAALDKLSDLFLSGRYEEGARLIVAGRAAGVFVHPMLAQTVGKALVGRARLADTGGEALSSARLWTLAAELRADPEAPAFADAAFRKLMAKAEEGADAGALDDAAELYGAAVSLRPQHLPAVRGHAELLERLARWREAGTAWLDLARAVEDEERAAALTRATDASTRLTDAGDALDLLTAADAIAPGDAGIREAGDARMRDVLAALQDDIDNDRLAAAAARYRQVNGWDQPSAAMPRQLLTRQLLATFRANKDDDATAAADAARLLIDVDPTHREALRFLGRFEQREGNHAAAAVILERLVIVEPGEPLHLLKLGRSYRALRDYPRSAEALGACLKAQPGNVDASRLLAELSAQGAT